MANFDSKPAVEVDGLSKLFTLGNIGASSLRESMERWWSEIRGVSYERKIDRAKDLRIAPERLGPTPNSFWALKDVSFQARRGEMIGVVGRNGAGKSTLLKVLSRISEPTEGRAILRGRVVSLLEVGTGFHPELTGRENIFLNGAILGMRRAEIAAKFDEIVEFSEIGAFIDTPVKRYSSGMYVRLAFAVAAHLEPEILFVDEVLAVGDAAFQKKCLGKMGEVSTEQGRTVFFVSHNMGAIRSLCETALLIDGGRLAMHGPAGEVISHYLAAGMEKGSEGERSWPAGAADAPGNDEIRLRHVRLLGPGGGVQATFEPDKPFAVEIAYEVRKRLRGLRFIVIILTQEGETAFAATDHEFQRTTHEPGAYRTTCRIPGELLNRRNYILSVKCDLPGERGLIEQTELLEFSVSGAGNQSSTQPETWPGAVCPRIAWDVA